MEVCQQIMMMALLSLMCLYSLATSLNRLETRKAEETIYMYIIGGNRTEKLTYVNGRTLKHVSTVEHLSSVGCNRCAYARHDKDLYMAGHYNPPYTQTSIFTAGGTVRSQPDLPTPGNYPQFTFILDGHQYVGMDSNEVYSRDLSMGSWVREVNLPDSIKWPARTAVVSQGVVFITGGWLDDSFDNPSNAAWSWSPGQAVWNQLPSMPHSHAAHCNVMVNSDIFVLGGLTTTGSFEYIGLQFSYYVDVYNVQSQTWTQRTEYVTDAVNTGHACAAAGTNIYVHVDDKVFIYDTLQDGNPWSLLHTMDTGLGWGTAMLIA